MVLGMIIVLCLLAIGIINLYSTIQERLEEKRNNQIEDVLSTYRKNNEDKLSEQEKN